MHSRLEKNTSPLHKRSFVAICSDSLLSINFLYPFTPSQGHRSLSQHALGKRQEDNVWRSQVSHIHTNTFTLTFAHAVNVSSQIHQIAHFGEVRGNRGKRGKHERSRWSPHRRDKDHCVSRILIVYSPILIVWHLGGSGTKCNTTERSILYITFESRQGECHGSEQATLAIHLLSCFWLPDEWVQ